MNSLTFIRLSQLKQRCCPAADPQSWEKEPLTTQYQLGAYMESGGLTCVNRTEPSPFQP